MALPSASQYQKIQGRVEEALKKAFREHVLNALPSITAGQARTLRDNEHYRNMLMGEFPDKELFFEWLKRYEDGGH